jgi:hypothetical protein
MVLLYTKYPNLKFDETKLITSRVICIVGFLYFFSTINSSRQMPLIIILALVLSTYNSIMSD